MSIIRLVVTFFGSLFKSRRQLALEGLALKQQVAMLRQSVKRPTATAADRMFWILFSRYVDGWRTTLHALHPDTVVRWHRQGRRQFGPGSEFGFRFPAAILRHSPTSTKPLQHPQRPVAPPCP